MKNLKEKLVLFGIYLSVGAMSMLCIWRVEQINNLPKNIDRNTIVMYEK